MNTRSSWVGPVCQGNGSRQTMKELSRYRYHSQLREIYVEGCARKQDQGQTERCHLDKPCYPAPHASAKVKGLMWRQVGFLALVSMNYDNTADLC